MAAGILRYFTDSLKTLCWPGLFSIFGCMAPQLDLSIFQKAGITLQHNSAVLGIGRQGFVVEDKGTAIKFYAANQGLPEAVSVRRAAAEANTLAWLEQHNDTGIRTPRPHALTVFPQPVEMHTPEGDFTFLAALRMERLHVNEPFFGPDWLEKTPQEGNRFFRSLGRTIAAFNNLAERMPAGNALAQGDDLPEALRFALARQPSQFVTPEALGLMLDDHAKLTAGKPQALKHGDLHPGNVSYDPRTQEVNAVFDWASVVKAPAGRDLHYFTALTDNPAQQARNNLVQEGYHDAISTQPDPALSRLYGVMQLARMIIRCETLAEPINESFGRYVLEPYQKSLASYRSLRKAAKPGLM